MATMSNTSRNNRVVEITDPPFARALFGDVRWSWLWLILRVYMGYTFVTAGIEKLTSPAWTQGGVALKGFWQAAVAVGEGAHGSPIAFGWYRDFINFLLNSGSYTWFAWLILISEILVGVALILGAFTGIAGFVGGFLSWNFMMAGTASINPVVFTIGILLILAWKTAGWLGADRWLLPALGTPWRPATVSRGERGKMAAPSAGAGS